MNSKYIISGIALAAVTMMVATAFVPVLEASAWFSSSSNYNNNYAGNIWQKQNNDQYGGHQNTQGNVQIGQNTGGSCVLCSGP